jgi:hypothetical protein
MNDCTSIRRGMSAAADEDQAAAELYQAINQDDMALAVFFCSPHYDCNQLALALKSQFGNTPVIGCTTAGEITPHGYATETLTGFSLGKSEFNVAINLFDRIHQMSIPMCQDAAQALIRLHQSQAKINPTNTFGLLLIDGSSAREEMLISGIHAGMADIPVFGGSAGDGLQFGNTWIYYDGQFHTQAAVLVLVHSLRPFRVFKTQHFAESSNASSLKSMANRLLLNMPVLLG